MNTLTHTAGTAPLAEAAGDYRRRTPTLLQTIGGSIWRSLEAVGHRRAARELALLADRWALFDPALASELRAASRAETGQADATLEVPR